MKAASEPTQDEINRVVGRLNVKKRVNEASGEHVIADCVRCGKVAHLYVNTETGAWDCKVCNAAGMLWSLATDLNMRLRDKPAIVSAGAIAQRMVQKRTEPVESAKVHKAHARLWDTEDVQGQAVYAYLKARGFTDDTMRRFLLHAVPMNGEPAVAIPYLQGNETVLVKMRNLATDKNLRRFMRHPKGAPSVLFNADSVKDCRQAILVEGELDAVSLHQFGFTNVASTSIGAKKDIPPEWMDALICAEDVVLWYDADATASEAVASLMEKLGTHRCRVASIPRELSKQIFESTGKRPKDVNDLLMAGCSRDVIASIIVNAQGQTNTSLVQPASYRDALENEILNGAASLGISTGYAPLDGLVRGVRESELWVVSGHTMHGKTSFTSALVEQVCEMHQEPVLFSSLENGPLNIARKIFQRKFGRPISTIRTDEDRERAIEKLGELNDRPIYLLDHQGRKPLSTITDALKHARYRLGVKVAVLDHAHFISKENPRQDEREWLDELALNLAGQTRDLRMTIILIVHVKGSVEIAQIPGADSLKGTSSWKQVADVGLSVYRSTDLNGDHKPRKLQLRDGTGTKTEVTMAKTDAMIYVWKTRHDEAREGSCILKFDPASLRYSVPEESEQEQNNQQDPWEAGQ